MLSGGVCIPLFAPDCCYTFVDTDCESDYEVTLGWCEAQTSSVAMYYIYQDGTFLESVSSSITEHIVTGSSSDICTSNFTVTAVFQTAPLVESDKTICNITDPTPAPTTPPTLVPTSPTNTPTVSPVTSEAPTLQPSMGLFCFLLLIVFVCSQAHKFIIFECSNIPMAQYTK